MVAECCIYKDALALPTPTIRRKSEVSSYAGQYMLANPDTGIVVVYFSVLENTGDPDPDPNFQGPLVKMMAKLSAE
ncbi:hypothetical protein NKJ06_30440 [Mesorhizobium sp. M0293]|uniref:hypothetical protein n=1 Tax=Mesorhizobium sp. M0293 TaxID=2956930 RepID=UPI00333A6152